MKLRRIIALRACLAACLAVSAPGAAQEVYTAPIAPPAATWPYTDFGKRGVVISRSDDALLGTTTIIFANGTRLIIKPTKNSPGMVSIDIAMGKGRAGAPSALVHALWATTLMPIGGTGKVSYAALDQWQQSSGKPVNITVVPGISAYHLQGEVPVADLETEMQLLTAYVRDPGFSDEQAQKIASIAPLMEAQIESSPSSMFLRAVQRALIGPDSRYAEIPAKDDLAATTGTELTELIKPALAGPADVTIVGDVAPADAIAATGLTIAAGLDRLAQYDAQSAAATPAATPTSPGTPIIVYNSADTRVSWYGAYWLLPDYKADPRGVSIAQVAAALIEAQLVEERPTVPSMAAPVVRAVNSLELHNGSALGIALQMQAEKADGVLVRLIRVIRAIADAPVDPEALKQARMMVLGAHTSEQKTNAWWLTRLSLVLRDPQIEPAMAATGNITSVSAVEVQIFIRRTILQRRPILVEILPAGA